MNPERLAEFDGFAARIVRPIAASGRRRGIMCEELFSHLCEAFAEELLGTSDEKLAAEKARIRLGDEDELRRRLQASTPFLERLVFSLIWRKEMVMSRWTWIVGSVTFVVGFAFAFGLAVVMPATAKLVRLIPASAAADQSSLDAAEILKASLWSLVVLAFAVMLAGVCVLGYAVRQRMARRV